MQNALDVSLQMCLQIPLNDILAYTKLSKAYFGFLEVLLKGHLGVLCGLERAVECVWRSVVWLSVSSNHECDSGVYEWCISGDKLTKEHIISLTPYASNDNTIHLGT